MKKAIILGLSSLMALSVLTMQMPAQAQTASPASGSSMQNTSPSSGCMTKHHKKHHKKGLPAVLQKLKSIDITKKALQAVLGNEKASQKSSERLLVKNCKKQ